MPNPLLVPLALLGGAVYLLTKHKDHVSEQPSFAPDAIQALTVDKDVGEGIEARYFKDAVVKAILDGMQSKGLEPVQSNISLPGLLFRIAAKDSDISAANACLLAMQKGIVLASLSCAMPSAPGDKLILFTTTEGRALANQQSAFAVLLDAQPMPGAVSGDVFEDAVGQQGDDAPFLGPEPPPAHANGVGYVGDPLGQSGYGDPAAI